MLGGGTPDTDSVVIRRRGKHLWLWCSQKFRRKKRTKKKGVHLMIDWVPRHTVDCSAMSAQNGDGLIPPHVEDVDLGSKSVRFQKRFTSSWFIFHCHRQRPVDLHVLRARRYEGLVKAAKAAMDRVEALGDPHKLPNKGPGKVNWG